MHALKQGIETIAPLTCTAWAALQPLATTRLVPTRQHLLRAGEPARHAYFIERGLLREYYTDSAGTETTRSFCKQGEFSGSLADLLAGGSAAVSIECLEAAEVIQLEWAGLDQLSEQHPSLMKFLRRIAELLYLRKTRRERDMLTLSAAERFRRFALEEAELNARLPRHMVASYLGITPVHLSRICGAERRSPTTATQTRRIRSAS